MAPLMDRRRVGTRPTFSVGREQRSRSRRRGHPQDAATRAPPELLQREPPPETIDAGNLARIVLVRIPEHLSGQERGLPHGCTFGCGRLFFGFVSLPSGEGRNALRLFLRAAPDEGSEPARRSSICDNSNARRTMEMPREVRTLTPALRARPMAVTPGGRGAKRCASDVPRHTVELRQRL